MDDENKKARKSAKKEYNDIVRQLAAFVKKRDRRIAKHQAEEAERKAQKQAELDERRKREKEERLQRARQYDDTAFVQEGVLEEESEEEEEEVRESWYCVACNKNFRSAKQLNNHEKSKKHIQRAAALRKMLEEDEEISIEKDSAEDEEQNVVIPEGERDEEGQGVEEIESVGQSNVDERVEDEDKTDEEEETEEDEDDILLRMMASAKKSPESESEESEAEVEIHSIEQKMADTLHVEDEGEDQDHVEDEDEDDILLRMMASAKKGKQPEESLSEEDIEPVRHVKNPSKAKKKGRSRKEKKVAQDPEHNALQCSTCERIFESRNQLFKHIKKTNHAALK